MGYNEQDAPHDVRFLKFIDTFTGKEVEGGVPTLVRHKLRHYTEEYVIMFQQALGELCCDPEMTGSMWRVWMLLISRMEMKNWYCLQQKDIAEKLKMDKADVSKIMKKLVAKNMLEKNHKMGRTVVYRIHPDFAWKGTGYDYVDDKRQRKLRLAVNNK